MMNTETILVIVADTRAGAMTGKLNELLSKAIHELDHEALKVLNRYVLDIVEFSSETVEDISDGDGEPQTIKRLNGGT